MAANPIAAERIERGDAELKEIRVDPHYEEERGASSAFAAACAKCFGFGTSTRSTRFRRQEKVFYDSARVKRTVLGKLHYCLSCPGWSKVTSERVVYSRWDLVPCERAAPIVCAGFCGCFDGAGTGWEAVSAPQSSTASNDAGSCPRVPVGRTLDTFDSDIIVDASAHQTLCQICRGEGDLVLFRKADADLSDPNELFVVSDVYRPMDVFNDLTFELSKIDLRGGAAQVLGGRMGATVWRLDARHDAPPPPKPFRGEKEFIYYDSESASRTCIGSVRNSEWCCAPAYKITSERVVFSDWDYWYICDEPVPGLCLAPYYVLRATLRECCCALGSSVYAYERVLARRKSAAADRDKKRACGCCALPVGRTAEYFDIDIVVDIQAHQSCFQLCVNEGDLKFGRLQGADASNDSAAEAFFVLKNAPEAFGLFDDLSFEFSKLDLKQFRRGALVNDMRGASFSRRPAAT